MAKKVVSIAALHKTKKKKPIKHSSRKQNLKIMLNKIMNYMKSDTYMFAPLVCPQSSLTSFPASTGEVSFEPIKKNEKKLMKDVEDYLKCDCYMYAPLVVDSASDCATTSDTSTGVYGDQKEPRIDEATGLVGNTSKDIGRDERHIPATKIAVKHITVKHVVHQNCRSSTVPEKVSSQKELRKATVK